MPFTTQTNEFVDLLMHIARPVMQRESSPAADGFGVLLCFSSSVGVRVIAVSRSQVRWSTSPVTGIARLSWKPFTALTVIDPYDPVTFPENQPICFSLACRSRTLSPESPDFQRAGPGTSRLCISSSVGLRVIETSLFHVRLSTSPVSG